MRRQARMDGRRGLNGDPVLNLEDHSLKLAGRTKCSSTHINDIVNVTHSTPILIAVLAIGPDADLDPDSGFGPGSWAA